MKKLFRLFITLLKLSRLHLPCFFFDKSKHILLSNYLSKHEIAIFPYRFLTTI